MVCRMEWALEWVLEWHLRCTPSTHTIMALHHPAQHTCTSTHHLHMHNPTTPHQPRTTPRRSIHESGPCPGSHHAVGPHLYILPRTHPWTLGRIRHGLMKSHLWNTILRENSVTALLQDTRNMMKTTIGCHPQEQSPNPGPGRRSTKRSNRSGQIHHGKCIPLPVLSRPSVAHPEAWTENEPWTGTEALTEIWTAWTCRNLQLPCQ
jgi:hypothetical protein